MGNSATFCDCSEDTTIDIQNSSKKPIRFITHMSMVQKVDV